jgi:hypothetical protein
MAEPYPNQIHGGHLTGSPPPRPIEGAEEPRSDAGQSDAVAAEHPKGEPRRSAPPGHPSAGTIDELGHPQ